MKEKKIYLSVALLTGILILNIVSVASAADNNSAVNEITAGLAGGEAGFGTTFQTQISNLSKSLLSSARIIAVIMTAAAGCMVCFGIQDGKKTFWNWILGIGLAINFGDLILNLWSVETAHAPTKIEDYKLLMKSEDDPSIDILSPFMRYYIGVIMSGAAVIAPYAINLTLILAMIDGAGTIKSFLAEKILTLKADRLFQKYTHKSFVGEFLDNAQEIIISTIDAGGIILLLTVGAWLIMQNNATISEVMTFYFVFGYFSTPVKRLTNLQPMLQSAIIAAERLDDVFETTKENIGGKEENFIDSSILLENVSFRYAHRDRILENVNLNISSNQHIAIIGESGSGKSTLGKLLIKLYLAEEGTIKIGGRQIEEYNLEKLRQQVVYVSQDSYIFRDSLRNNLILGMENITDEKIVEICNMCHLGKMLERFPGGLDTVLDENGANLSSGERERVNIARALLVNPKILIVDEITSNLDYNLENSIMQLLDSLKNTTVVQITHRLSTIKKCDNIIVMKDGKIAESGKFDELFNLKGELYSFLKNGHLID